MGLNDKCGGFLIKKYKKRVYRRNNTFEGECSMKYAKIITWLGLLAMSAGLLNGFINGDFFIDGAALFENPWGVMSLIDLYVGFVLFSLWIVYRESSKISIFIWVLAMMILGFFTACIYILIALYTSDGDWDYIFHGKKGKIS